MLSLILLRLALLFILKEDFRYYQLISKLKIVKNHNLYSYWLCKNFVFAQCHLHAAKILYNIFLYMQIAEVMYNPTSIFIHIFSISLVPSQISSSSSYFWNTFYHMFFISLAIYANREKHHWITYSLVNLQGQYGLDLILWSARTVIPSSIQYWLCKWLNIGESIIWKHWFSIVNSN